MAVRILRRIKAVEDAEAIANHIGNDSLKAAIRFLENTESTLAQLAESTGSGSRFESLHPDWPTCTFAVSRDSQTTSSSSSNTKMQLRSCAFCMAHKILLQSCEEHDVPLIRRYGCTLHRGTGQGRLAAGRKITAG